MGWTFVQFQTFRQGQYKPSDGGYELTYEELAMAKQYRPIVDGGHLVRKYYPDQFAPDYVGIIQFEGRKIRVRAWMEANDRLMMKQEPLGAAATPIDDSTY